MEGAQVGFLLQQDDAGPRHDRPPPLVRIDDARDQFQERRLARAVAPDERKPVALADLQVEVAKEPSRSLDEAEVFVSEDWCGHGVCA